MVRPGYLAQHAPEDYAFIAYDETHDHLPQQRWLRKVAGKRAVVLRTSELEAEWRDGWIASIVKQGSSRPFGGNGYRNLVQSAAYSSKRPVASRSRSYRFVSGNGGSQDSRRTVQSSYVGLS